MTDLYKDYVRLANKCGLLQAQRMALLQALVPFAAIGSSLPACLPDDASVLFGKWPIRASDLREAYNVMHLFDDPAGSKPQTTEATASESSPAGPSSTTTEAP